MMDHLPPPLYVTEKELARRLGFSDVRWRAIRAAYDAAGLPRPEPIAGLRYWPKVEAFFDRLNGLDKRTSPAPMPAVSHADELAKENPEALIGRRGRRSFSTK